MATSPPSYSPGRPPNQRDIELLMNGDPQPLGILTSTGAAVNNVTTATPFNRGTLMADNVSRTLLGSLAGRVLLISPTAAGFFLTSSSPQVGVPTVITVALNTTIPPAANTFPGVPLNPGDVRGLIMSPTSGWVQWISTTGTSSLVMWEMI